jgi:hypothetical protein
MFFDHPKNALSVARTHQRELLHQEQMNRLGRQAQLAHPGPEGHWLSRQWQALRSVSWWWKARLAKGASAQVRTRQPLPE